MQNIKINNQTIAPGEHKWISINSYELPVGSTVDIPAFIARSKYDGPTVLFSAGMHGDETNGIEILRSLLFEKHLSNLQIGTVIVIPVINTVSFIYNSRELPDGKDLNRLFPGTKNGSLGARIAYDLVNEILPLIDVGVDFHTGGNQINNYPQLRCLFSDSKHVELAKMFGAPFIINSEHRDKSFRQVADKNDKTILVYEGGESLRFNKLAITQGVIGCLRLLNNLKMLTNDIDNAQSIIIGESTWLRAQYSGMFKTLKKYGEKVNKGDAIASITDVYGKENHIIESTTSGYIIGVNNKPVVNLGDALIHVGIEKV